jgi:signal transduction histidine kinase
VRRLSIRARITLGSAAIAAVLLAVALFAVHAQVAIILGNTNVTLAQGDLVSFEKDIVANPTESVDDPGTGVLVYVRNPAGVVEVNTLPHDVNLAVDGRATATEQFTITDDEGRNFVVVGQSVQTSDGTWALWSARNTSSIELALDSLNGWLIGGGLALLFGFALASWLLASAALRPVAAMRRQAELLGSDPGDGGLAVGDVHDELSELAMTLNDLLARVRDSAAREKQIVSDAAHELRTPLAALRTQLELAHDDFGDAHALAAQVSAAEDSVQRLTSLASNLLELSRLDATSERERASTVSQLENEFLGSIDRARLLGLGTHADIGFELELTDAAARIAVDSDSFGRMLDNVLVNSIAATGQGGEVTASLRQSQVGLTLEVRDDGPGMPESFLPRAFERFSRPDGARTSATGGSGLGLALVRAIAEAAGGSATATNSHPGLVVTVTLPQL